MRGRRGKFVGQREQVRKLDILRQAAAAPPEPPQTRAEELAALALWHLVRGKPMLQRCRVCRGVFRTEVDELQRRHDAGLRLPDRCGACAAAKAERAAASAARIAARTARAEAEAAARAEARVAAEVGRALRRVCCGCGAPFELDPGALRWYAGRGFRLPKRCGACRWAAAAKKLDGWEAMAEPTSQEAEAVEAEVAAEARGRLARGEPLIRACVACRAEFEVDVGALRRCFADGFHLPRQCRVCRRAAAKAGRAAGNFVRDFP